MHVRSVPDKQVLQKFELYFSILQKLSQTGRLITTDYQYLCSVIKETKKNFLLRIWQSRRCTKHAKVLLAFNFVQGSPAALQVQNFGLKHLCTWLTCLEHFVHCSKNPAPWAGNGTWQTNKYTYLESGRMKKLYGLHLSSWANWSPDQTSECSSNQWLRQRSQQ